MLFLNEAMFSKRTA